MNPLSAKGQIQGAVIQGIGMALHEDMVYDRRSGQPLTVGYYGARVATHLDAPDVEVTFLENDDGYGPVRREEHRRVGHHPGAGGGGQCHLQRHRAGG